MAGTKADSKNLNLHLTSLLSRFYYLEEVVKGLKELNKEIHSITEVHDSLQSSLKLLKHLGSNKSGLSSEIKNGESSIKHFATVLNRNIQELKSQRTAIIQNRSIFLKSRAIKTFLESYEKDSNDDWVTGCYLFHLTHAFIVNDKVSWTKINQFLREHSQFIPPSMGKHFSDEAIRARVNRYLSFCKKHRINQTLNFFPKAE